MTERELIESTVILTCGNEDCPICKVSASTMEQLMEDEDD